MYTKITYHVEQHDQDFYFYIDDNDLEELDIPWSVKDEISSFGLTPRRSHYSNRMTSNQVWEQLCEKLHSLFMKIWNSGFGIPVFEFKGDIANIDNEYIKRPLIIFMRLVDCSQEELTKKYSTAISLQVKFVFVVINHGGYVCFVTKSHNTTNSWLSGLVYEDRLNVMQSDKFDTTLRMKNWYADGFREDLIKEARNAINQFIIKKKLDLFIDDFLVVPVYHIRRYQKAFNLLNEKYNVLFIMTLPLHYNREEYTILFPVRQHIKVKK